MKQLNRLILTFLIASQCYGGPASKLQMCDHALQDCRQLVTEEMYYENTLKKQLKETEAKEEVGTDDKVLWFFIGAAVTGVAMGTVLLMEGGKR